MAKTTDKLTACWSTKIDAINYTYPQSSQAKALNYFFKTIKNADKKTLLEELELQGFDIKTLKFEIKLKKKEEE